MPKVVSNTTPLLSLLKIGHPHLLEAIYKKIIVPAAVWQEVEAGRGKPYYTDLTQLSWIEILNVQERTKIAKFLSLDQGEAEAIVLTIEIKADLLIMDEALGRTEAMNHGLTLAGTLGILLKAKQKGLISSVRPLLDLMRQRDVWISERLYQDVLSLSGE